jgi:MoaA/NifB/PqqE/SkfB family radical SAM enzyme
LLLKEKIHLFKPSKYLTFSVHLDGQREEHDLAVCREGGYDIAVDANQRSASRGFRVTTNTTLFDGADPKSVRAFLRRHDGAWSRRHDALARVLLR